MKTNNIGNSASKANKRLRERLDSKQRLESKQKESSKFREEDGQFILMSRTSFLEWLKEETVTRSIKRIQNHHTYIPNYGHFEEQGAFKLMKGMKRSHLKRKFSDIAQNLTTFPDGRICVGRPLDTIPAGIRGANTGGICIEHVGDFDEGKDIMSEEQKKTIVWLNAVLLEHFGLPTDTDSVVYHHWWTASGRRTNGVRAAKSCPGTNFFGGNKVEDCEKNFLPKIQEVRGRLG